jgi:hypothetical protein
LFAIEPVVKRIKVANAYPKPLVQIATGGNDDGYETGLRREAYRSSQERLGRLVSPEGNDE